MSNNAPNSESPRANGRGRRPSVPGLTDWLLGWPILFATSGVWFFFGARLIHRFGPDALATAAGVMIAVAVGVTLWRWSVRDTHREMVAAGACPRCTSVITRFEEPPRPGALARGLRGWRCANCGLEEAGPLTPARDAS